jgi:hypothetical protein
MPEFILVLLIGGLVCSGLYAAICGIVLAFNNDVLEAEF